MPMDPKVSSPEQLSLLFELTRAFSALATLEALLPSIIAQTKAVLQAESCALLLLDEQKQELFFPVVSDLSADVEARFTQIRFPADRGVSGWVLQHGQAIHVADVSRDSRFYANVDQDTGMRTRELLCAPLRTRHGAIGVIELRNKVLGAFTEEDLIFLDALSGSIAIAIENARIYQQVQESAAHLQAQVATLQREMAHRQRFEEIVGGSAAMARLFALMESAIPASITVLLEGETGTGKELIARAIHAHGPRKDRPFVAVNCGALPDTLLESELFGHKKGSFTGALQDRIGLFEAAHGGTIFLDEIGEMVPAMQVKLLRVLQEGEIRRVGETQARRVDVRVISATNKDLVQEVRAKRFRDDLYYRIRVFAIQVPPLRERREDIPLLVARFLPRSSEKFGKHLPGLTPQALDCLVSYPWPGNVRELENEIERAVALTPDGSAVPPEALSTHIQRSRDVPPVSTAEVRSLREARMAFERDYLASVLRQHHGNVAQSARALGISRQMLQLKIKTYGLQIRGP